MLKKLKSNTPQLATVLVGLFVAGFVMLMPLSVSAQCPQWDARRMYSIKQSNNIEVKLVTLIQRGPRISGTASFQGKTRIENGTIRGDFKGDIFKIEIKWDYGETGVYTGQRVQEKAPRGTLNYLVGDAYIKEQPNNKARKTTWRGSTAINCLQD